LKNKFKKSLQKQKVDVYSSFTEDNIEFVTPEDEREAVAHVLHSQEIDFFNQEREYYGQNH
jgi:hypothetical protein